MLDSTPQPHTLIEAELPPEPAVRSVVVDRDGDAWQSYPLFRHDPEWVRVMSVQTFGMRSPGGKPWPRVLVEHGPLTLVYDAGE